MIPYRDVETHHFIGFVVPFWILDKLIEITPAVIDLMAITFNFINSILIYFLVRELTNNKPASKVAALFAASAGWLWSWGGASFNNQSFFLPLLNLLILLTVISIKKGNLSYLISTSFLYGILLTFDIRLIVFIPLIFIILINNAEYRLITKSLLSFCAISTYPIILILLLYSNDALLPFIEHAIKFPFFAKSTGLNSEYFTRGISLLGFAAGSQPFIFILLAIGIALFSLSNSNIYLRLVIIITLAAGVLYVIAAGRDRPNYCLIFYPVCFTSIGLSVALSLSRDFLKKIVNICLVLGFLIVTILPVSLILTTGSIFLNPQLEVITNSLRVIERLSDENDHILVTGYMPSIYVLSKRFSSIRDISLNSITGDNEVTANFSGWKSPGRENFKRDLTERPPILIIDFEALPSSNQDLTLPEKLLMPIDFSRTFPMLFKNLETSPRLEELRAIVKQGYIKIDEMTSSKEKIRIFLRKN